MVQNNNIAVIGANSYIARNLIRVNRLDGGPELSLYGRRPAQLDGEGPYAQIDMLSRCDMEKAVEGHSVIFFFTGKMGTLDGFETPDTYIDINEKMLLNLLNACREKNRDAKIVFPSTRLVYKGATQELREDAEKEFLTPYAIQKFACEQYLKMYQNMFGLHYAVLRIGVPYGSLIGPANSYGTLGFFEKQAKEKGVISVYGTGEQKRTFTYIEDLCRFLLASGRDERCVDDVYNVGGEALSIRQIAEKIAMLYQAKVASTPWPESACKVESGDTVFDSTKLEGILGLRPSMSMNRWLACAGAGK